MYHPQWYVTRGWYIIILHSTCITMDRLSSQSIIDDTIWYITWYIMIHVSSKSTLIHWWYVVIHMYQPWTELIHRWYIVLTPPRLRVGGDYVDTLLIHWWYVDDTMYQPETVSQTTLMCGHIVDTWLIHCINSAHVAGSRRLCWYIVDTLYHLCPRCWLEVTCWSDPGTAAVWPASRRRRPCRCLPDVATYCCEHAFMACLYDQLASFTQVKHCF